MSQAPLIYNYRHKVFVMHFLSSKLDESISIASADDESAQEEEGKRTQLLSAMGVQYLEEFDVSVLTEIDDINILYIIYTVHLCPIV